MLLSCHKKFYHKGIRKEFSKKHKGFLLMLINARRDLKPPTDFLSDGIPVQWFKSLNLLRDDFANASGNNRTLKLTYIFCFRGVEIILVMNCKNQAI
ncbi:hypothetical protein [Marinifilum sp.]|uniref:hypothetical protein n=1 Tax=Marinifilum sp. TaxID=2033137 RepID=UPI003BAC2AB4